MRKLAQWLEMSEEDVKQGLFGLVCTIIAFALVGLTIFIGMLF